MNALYLLQDSQQLKEDLAKVNLSNKEFEEKIASYETELHQLRGNVDLLEETRKTEQQFKVIFVILFLTQHKSHCVKYYIFTL